MLASVLMLFVQNGHDSPAKRNGSGRASGPRMNPIMNQRNPRPPRLVPMAPVTVPQTAEKIRYHCQNSGSLLRIGTNLSTHRCNAVPALLVFIARRFDTKAEPLTDSSADVA